MRFGGVALLAAGLFAAPSLARAQPFQGIYIGAGAGYNALMNVDTRASPGLETPALTFKTSAGFAGLLSAGYGFGNGFRVEIEGNYRQNDPGRLFGTLFPTTFNGTVRTYGAMANVLFDMDIGYPWIYPYLGIGAGYAWTDLDQVGITGTTTPFALRVDGTQGRFAYQAMAGLSFPMPDVPGLSLTTEYRFFQVVGPATFEGTSEFGAPAMPGAGNFVLRSQYNHSLLFGIRYAFNVSPPASAAAASPAPVSAPAPEPARSYLVFFDWDRADLTDRARQIIREAADNSTRVQFTRIEVNGYTDTSGSAEYNQRLSARRAQAVAAELVKDGVPRDSISVQGLGATNLLVPTGKGVREPQNRRVEIIMR